MEIKKIYNNLSELSYKVKLNLRGTDPVYKECLDLIIKFKNNLDTLSKTDAKIQKAFLPSVFSKYMSLDFSIHEKIDLNQKKYLFAIIFVTNNCRYTADIWANTEIMARQKFNRYRTDCHIKRVVEIQEETKLYQPILV